MKTLSLHLWREWREHRATLLFLVVALPLLSVLAAFRLPRVFVDDPWMACALSATFVIVVLTAVGGELLGRERRGNGLRWLERLPGGLGQALAAKLSLHFVTSLLAGLAGFALAQALAWLRGRGDFQWTNELDVTLPLLVILSAWTFACSAWALRGGTAILAAALVLGLGGYPVGHVVLEGYRPGTNELVIGTCLFVLAGLGSGALAFLLGSRRGAGSGLAIAFGLLPMMPLVAIEGAWSLDRLERRARLDPAAGDLVLGETWVTEDGKTAFVAVRHEDPQWGDTMPPQVLRVDLATGAWSPLVRDLEGYRTLSSARENGLMRTSALVLNSYDPPQELVFSLLDGSPTTRFEDRTNWHRAGLGQWLWTPGSDEGRYYDPFRGRSYPESELEDLVDDPMLDVFICPGRWLLESMGHWHLYDPDTHDTELVELPQYSDLLALLPDGRALFDATTIVCLDPSTGAQTEIERADVLANDGAFRAPPCWGGSPMSPDGPVLLRGSSGNDSYVLDPQTLSLRVLHAPSAPQWHVASFPDGRVLLRDDNSLVELDLGSGKRRTIFPAGPSS